MLVRQPLEAIQEVIQPLSGSPMDYDALLRAVGDAHFVLIGEASHGTHEFYRERAKITKRLIEQNGFDAVAIEGDWPDAYRVNRYVRGEGDDTTAEESLRDFRRFPQWMWRNADVLDFVGWLREYNASLPLHASKVAFYGLDLYSLNASMAEVIAYLEKVDPEAAVRARNRYACFDHFGGVKEYGYAAGLGLSPTCENAVVNQLVDFRRSAAAYSTRDGSIPPDEWFYALENAKLVRNAENYYRAMFSGHVNTWNLRDAHMADTIVSLEKHLIRAGRRPKMVIWEHNSHVGDARATDRTEAGEWNVGQLARQRYASDVFLIGFSTYTGTVTAASDWDAPAERKVVRPALAGSYEEMLFQVDAPSFYLTLQDKAGIEELDERRLQRAIGVIYRPETERQSHYFYTRLARQFDALIHFDESRAVEPLEKTAVWERGEVPDLYPTGI